MDYPELNLDKICRACKCEHTEMYSMFDNEILLNQSEKIYEMFMACTSLQVSDSDGMPKLICSTCIEQLNNAYNFKKQCMDTDSYLREYMQKCIKIEGPNVDVENNSELISDVEEKVKKESDDDSLLNIVFDCKFCEKKFIDLSSLQLHVKKNHQISDTKCRLCLTEFENLITLKQHIQDVHANKMYVCKICKKDKLAFSHLKRHLMSHLKYKPYACSVCDRRFLRSDHLSVHLKKCKGLKSFICDICNKGFAREDSLQCHVQLHSMKENLKVLDSVENFLDHYIELNNGNETDNKDVEMSSLFHSPKSDSEFFTDNNDENFECSMDNTIAQLKDIEPLVCKDEIKVEKSENISEENASEISVKRKRGRPRKIEGKVDKYSCVYCDKVLKTKLGYDIHVKKHGDGNIFNCTKCFKKFTEEHHLSIHLESHSDNLDVKGEVQEPQQCDICNEQFPSLDQLIKHKLQTHNVKMKTSSDKKYTCYICKKNFTTEKYRDIHEKTHSTEKMCACKTCGKRFSTKANLSEHMKFHNECSKKFLCSECGQRFIRYDYLVIHMRRHRGEKPFKCRYCGKGFPRTTDLTVHERYHTGEKTHLCVICGRGFGRAYNLTVHMRTHTGEKPYECTYCDAAFAQGNDLKAHVRRHTGERYYCDICSEPFLMGYLLTQHKRTVHGLDVKSHIRRLKPSERVNVSNSTKEPITVVPCDNQTSDNSAQLQLGEVLQDTAVLDITNNLNDNVGIMSGDLTNQIKSEVIADNLVNQTEPEFSSQIADAVT